MTVKNGSFEVVSTVAMCTIQSVSSSSTLVLIFGRSRVEEAFIRIMGLGSAVVLCLVPSLTDSSLTLHLSISFQIFSTPSMETNRNDGQSNRLQIQKLKTPPVLNYLCF
jgi:hypothetical protein